MSYACLSHQDGATSWSSFDRDIHSLSDLSTENIARMAALGPSLSGIGDWLSDQVQQVVDWVSNPSPIPLSLFSQLARTAPYSLPGVRYNIPSHADPDVKALFTASQWNKAVVTYSFPIPDGTTKSSIRVRWAIDRHPSRQSRPFAMLLKATAPL